MTLNEVINMADELKPNAFSPTVKVGWLNDCEGLIQTDVFLLEPENTLRYTYERDGNAELLAVSPYDKLYWTYLAAMIDFGLGEYSKYQNTMQLFNTYLGEYQRWYARRYKPADRGNDNVFIYTVIKGETPTFEFDTQQTVTAAEVRIEQGSILLEYDLEDMEQAEGVLSLKLPREDSLSLETGLAIMTAEIATPEQEYKATPVVRLVIKENT